MDEAQLLPQLRLYTCTGLSACFGFAAIGLSSLARCRAVLLSRTRCRLFLLSWNHMSPTAVPFTTSTVTTQATSTVEHSHTVKRHGTAWHTADYSTSTTYFSSGRNTAVLGTSEDRTNAPESRLSPSVPSLDPQHVVKSRPRTTPESYAASAISPNGARRGDHDSTTNSDGVCAIQVETPARSHRSQRELSAKVQKLPALARSRPRTRT